MGKPDAFQFVVLAITVVTAVVIGSVSPAVRTTLGESATDDESKRSDQWKWWLLVLSAMIVGGVVLISAYLPRMEWNDWDTCTLAISAAMAIYIGSVCESLRSRITDREGDDKANAWNKRKTWFLLPSPLLLALMAMISAFFQRPRWDRLYRDLCTLAITVPLVVYVGMVCQAARTKIAKSTRGDKAKGYWSFLLFSLVVIETGLIGVSLLMVNRVYWVIGAIGTKTMVAMLAFLITVVAMFCFGAFLFVSLRATLRKRWLTTREFMFYVAGAGMIMALPMWVQAKTSVWGDLVETHYIINWSSLFLSLVLLAVIAFHVRRNSRQ
jgi:hypothetical protein